MNHSPLRVALIGLGWAARNIWLDRLLAHPGYAVAAAVDPDPQARAAFAPSGGRVLASVSELDPAEVDLAIVAVPNHLHATIAGELLRLGVPAFVEKPVCLNSAEADQLAAAERAGGTPLLAGSAARHRADVRALYAALDMVGELRHLEASWVRSRGVPGAGGWFTDRRRAGGGALLDLGWHLLDVLEPLIGGLGYEHVVGSVSGDFVASGAGGAHWRGDGRAAAGDVEDTARGFLVTETGLSVALRVGWASHEARDVTRIYVEGTDGALTMTGTFGFSPNRAGGSTLSLTRHGVVTDLTPDQEPIGTEYDRQLDHLLKLVADPSVRGRAVSEADRTIRLIERLYGAARRDPVPARAVLSPAPQ